MKRSVIGAVKLPSPNHLGPGLIFQLPPLAYMLYPALAHTDGVGGRVLNDQLRLVARIWMRIRTEEESISEQQG